MNKKFKFFIIVILSFIIMFMAMGIGSVNIKLSDTIQILLYKIFNFNFPSNINEKYISIIWKIRFPRVILAFVAGSGLAISGVIMQSILKNPMASSYTIGISSGAALGAGISLLFGSIFGIFTLQIFGFLFGMLTIFIVISLSLKIDKNIQNNSIILMGMSISLFTNALLSIIINFSKEEARGILFWQMGSFTTKDFRQILLLIIVLILSFSIIFKFYREMNILTLGDEQAKVLGIDVKKLKINLLILSSLLTGVIVSIVGVIGFVDLFTPHISRKIFGANHKYILPSSAILGGMFMVLCDLLARTLTAPLEIPVGSITALIGAPFFIYLYFNKRIN